MLPWPRRLARHRAVCSEQCFVERPVRAPRPWRRGPERAPAFRAGNLWLRDAGKTQGPSAARTGPGCLRSQPRLPWSPGRTSEAHVCQMFWKPGQRIWLCGSPGSPRLPLLQGFGGGGGMGQPSSRRFPIKSRLWTCCSHLFYCLYGNYQPLKELWVYCSWHVPSHRV